MKKEKALVTSRVLFVSILDKIYLLSLAIIFVSMTYSNLSTYYGSYPFWEKMSNQLFIFIFLVILYFIFNWFYKCAIKTMLCVTKKEVYGEIYFPFIKIEKNIPLNKITKVSTYNYFWIFRALVIYQYNKLPLIFFTWNNKEFKNKLRELIIEADEEIENEFENKNLISRNNIKYIGIILGILTGLTVIIGLYNYISDPIKRIPGTYSYEDKNIILNKDGSCNIDDIVDSYHNCTWEYNKSLESLSIEYDYSYFSYYANKYITSSRSLDVDYVLKDKTLIYDDNTYKKN